MKKYLNKFLLLSALLSLIGNVSVSAQDVEPEGKRGPRNEEKFSEMKTDMISNLNQEKLAIDQTIACVNSAQKGDDLEKCREIKRAAMDKMKEAHMAKRKQRLEQELKELNEQQANAANKTGFQRKANQK